MALLNLRFKKRFSVAVFCGSRNGNSDAYKTAAADMGRLLAENGMRLVYGAGGSGLMGVLAMGVLKNGGKVYGVTERIVSTFEGPIREIVHRTARDIQRRKREFIAHSDAFVVLAGGWGTYDELLDVIIGKEIVDRHRRYAKKVVYREDRPIVIVNTNNYYNPFLAMVEAGIRDGFMMREDLAFFKVVKTPREAMDFINKSRGK
jgi:uncharacterized protein (TIGR00730 family)